VEYFIKNKKEGIIIPYLKKIVQEIIENLFVLSVVIVFGVLIVVLSSTFSILYFKDNNPETINLFVTAILGSAIMMLGLNQMKESKKNKESKTQEPNFQEPSE